MEERSTKKIHGWICWSREKRTRSSVKVLYKHTIWSLVDACGLLNKNHSPKPPKLLLQAEPNLNEYLSRMKQGFWVPGFVKPGIARTFDAIRLPPTGSPGNLLERPLNTPRARIEALVGKRCCVVLVAHAGGIGKTRHTERFPGLECWTNNR